MARKTKNATAPQNTHLDRAHTIAEKIGDQIRTLVGRNWREISEILDDADTGNEIKLSIGTTITDRPAEPGTQATKDNRVVTTLAWSVKHSDKIESDIPDPLQPDLPVNGGEPAEPAID